MTEITKDLHEQVKYEQYKIAVVDIFMVQCPYCGNEIKTRQLMHVVCKCCNQFVTLFCTEQQAEQHLNKRHIRRNGDL